MAFRVDWGSVVQDDLGAAVSASIQRAAWEKGMIPGSLVTGGLLIGAPIVASMVGGGGFLGRGIRAMGTGAAAVTGWVLTEKYALGMLPDAAPAYMPAAAAAKALSAGAARSVTGARATQEQFQNVREW